MSTDSAIYLIIFLPLITSLFCQLFAKKEWQFLSAILCAIIVLILSFKIFPHILIESKSNDFELSTLSLALEYKVDGFVLSFIIALTLLKLIILFYHKDDIEDFLSALNSKFFCAAYLLNLFTLIGILTTNNCLNLFLFLELYAVSFFAIFSISQDQKIAKLSFDYFCLNAAMSLLILFCILMLYLSFGSVNFDIIKQNLVNQGNQFFNIIALLLAISLLIKLMPFWLYFKNLKNANIFANFFATDALFVKVNLAIFFAFKFSYLFFSNDFACVLIALLAFCLLVYSVIKLYQTRHFKIIATYLCMANIALIFICLSLNNEAAFKAAFYYWINFNLVNFFLFLFATFLIRKFKTSLINHITLILANDNLGNKLLVLPLRLLTIFIAALPFTFLFYGNYNLAKLLIENQDLLIFTCGLVFLILINASYLIFALKIAKYSFFTDENLKFSPDKILTLSLKRCLFYLISFWLIILVIFYLIFNLSLLNQISSAFALSVLP